MVRYLSSRCRYLIWRQCNDSWARGAAGLAIQRFFDFEAAAATSDYQPVKGKTNSKPKLLQTS